MLTKVKSNRWCTDCILCAAACPHDTSNQRPNQCNAGDGRCDTNRDCGAAEQCCWRNSGCDSQCYDAAGLPVGKWPPLATSRPWEMTCALIISQISCCFSTAMFYCLQNPKENVLGSFFEKYITYELYELFISLCIKTFVVFSSLPNLSALRVTLQLI